jgi:Na+/H+-translocating membrane pyrophosphatase
MTDGVFDKQKGKNLVAYVNDIVVKSDKKETHIQYLQETFKNLRKSSLKLNPDKCIFGIKKGKMLDYLVSARGIEANPKKIAAIVNMKPPISRKQV